MIQDILIPVAMPSIANRATRVARQVQQREKAAQQDKVRRYLDQMAVRPWLSPPAITVEVEFIRLGRGMLDDDNLPNACKYVRDTVARWAHGLPETVPRKKHGRVVINKRGVVQMTRLHAPDGPRDGIRWRAEKQQRSRANGVRIIIRQLVHPVVDVRQGATK